MHIVVLVKPVPVVGTERLDADLRTDRATLELNGNDEYMLERALKLTEAHGGEVSMLAMAPAAGVDALRKGLAIGATRAYHVVDDALAGSTSGRRSTVLCAALRRIDRRPRVRRCGFLGWGRVDRQCCHRGTAGPAVPRRRRGHRRWSSGRRAAVRVRSGRSTAATRSSRSACRRWSWAPSCWASRGIRRCVDHGRAQPRDRHLGPRGAGHRPRRCRAGRRHDPGAGTTTPPARGAAEVVTTPPAEAALAVVDLLASRGLI